MQLFLDINSASQYTSQSQKIRVSTENWVKDFIYCPNCGNSMVKYENNRPVADFFCPNCNEEYELKSKKGNIGNKIVDGAYKTMIERLSDNNNPNLFLLNYNHDNYCVNNFLVVPKHFFITSLIEKRLPLKNNARRAGWVGCNILLGNIPQDGRIHYIKNGNVQDKQTILSDWQKTLFLRNRKDEAIKGWIFDIMTCIRQIGKNEFSLKDLYVFEDYLTKKHPENNHIQAKIRQQLQLLRNNGYLKFLSKGQYKLI